MIVVRLKGGLGNQMFQYALGRILSIKNNTELVFNIEAYEDKSPRMFKSNFAIREYDLEVFNIKGRVANKNEIPFLYRMYFKGKFMVLIDAVRRRIFKHKGLEISFKKFDPSILKLKDNSYLDGFFQSYKYFIDYENIIREDFSLKGELPENVINLKKEIQSINSLCVFVRRKDFIGNKYHEIVNDDFYLNGTKKIIESHKVDKIFVFSDDIKWCENNLKFTVETMFVNDDYAGTGWSYHMLLMSCCRYFVIPNSTFSWWGAWLSDREGKVVLLPSKWVNDSSVDINDIALKEWIKI